jgi:Protein containing tetrapyrrole methyltransferase domain and MazG-like (predicted pyrophosphatase) domain
MSKNSFDIALAGIGIGGFEQTTLETLEVFKRARIIFHLTSYHQRLRKFCKQVIDLEKEYWTGELDTDVYARLARIVLDEARRGPRVVMVGDGHPAYYDDVTWDIYRQGKRRGLNVRILPAISSIDSMAVHCGLEINSNGLQILDATSIVAATQELNPYLDTLIMQIGWFGTSLTSEISHSKKGRFNPLIKYLSRFYPKNHRVSIMSAPYSKNDRPVKITTKLGSLDDHHKRILPIMSLFIPGLPQDIDNSEFLRDTASVEHLKEIADLAS